MVITLPGYASTHDVASRGEQIASLRSRLAGELVMAGDARYDELRQVQDVTLDRRPLAIVRAANAEDVAAAVRFARDHGLAAGRAQRRPQPRRPQHGRRRHRRRPVRR